MGWGRLKEKCGTWLNGGQGTCLRLGFEWPHAILNLFRNTAPCGGESNVVIEKGDAIRTGDVSNDPGPGNGTGVLFGPFAPAASQD